LSALGFAQFSAWADLNRKVLPPKHMQDSTHQNPVTEIYLLLPFLSCARPAWTRWYTIIPTAPGPGRRAVGRLTGGTDPGFEVWDLTTAHRGVAYLCVLGSSLCPSRCRGRYNFVTFESFVARPSPLSDRYRYEARNRNTATRHCLDDCILLNIVVVSGRWRWGKVSGD